MNQQIHFLVNTATIGHIVNKYRTNTSLSHDQTSGLCARRLFDALQSMDQYMEPDQYEDQAAQNNSAEVRLSDRADQDDRAVYRLDPLTSGMELRTDTRPDVRTDRTRPRPSQPSRQAKANSRARLDLGREDSQNDHDFSHDFSRSSGGLSRPSRVRPAPYCDGANLVG